MEIRFQQTSKLFGEVEALRPLDLTVPDGQFLSLLGPSGCGKTTALRLLAGLEVPSGGSIQIGERDVTKLEPRDRDVAMVFQSYALYPHMTVSQNIGYPLKLRKVEKADRARQVLEVAELLGIEKLLERTPRQLSGGQRQRVALARAIVRRPVAFLMDEPLSNLDAQLRFQMRAEIKRLQRKLEVTTLYVTHDQVEAMTMSDMIAVLKDGELQQVATPAELYAHPANLFVAHFCGSPPMNILDGQISEGRITHPHGSLAVGPGGHRGPVKFGFRPEHASIAPAGGGAGLAGKIYVVEPLGNETLVVVVLGDERVNVRMPADFHASIGDSCAVTTDAARIQLFDPESEKAIGAGAVIRADAQDTVGGVPAG